MGCTSSSVATRRNGVMDKNPLTEIEIQQRIDAPKVCKDLSIGGMELRYAWVSQRGYYPDSIDKDNQDAFIALPNIGKSSDQAFMGIFDGHGRDGHHCARYVRDKLANQIADGLDKLASAVPSSVEIKTVLRSAHLKVNEMMHAEKKFDDSLSGTTSISMLLRGRTMYISNVGDSRAVLVSMKDGRLIAKPLSSDQTPYRKDERERIKKTGARVLSMDQIEGLEPVHENWGDLNLGEDIDEGGDPPRVWSPKGDYPGTAFTRSIGDRIAEDCGVYAEPELLVRDIEANDKFIVIASDGVFEFLTNQMVADECARHNDPLVACQNVVSQAYHLWLQYEVRTDDISMIAIYIDQFSTPASTADSLLNVTAATDTASGMSGKGMEIKRQMSLELSEQRPVRRVMSREKRKNMIEVHETALDQEIAEERSVAELQAHTVPKSGEDIATISAAINSNFLFQHLDAEQRASLINVMQEVRVQAGQRVIRQGDRGDLFYVVDHGRFEVRVRANQEAVQAPTLRDKMLSIISIDRAPTASKIVFEPNFEQLGNVVHVYEGGPNSHPGFGELSLMYGKPRAASVIALTDGKLWALDRKVFTRAVLRPKDNRASIIRTLKNVDLLKVLTLTQLQHLTDLLCEESFAKGDVIIKQGAPAEKLYLLTRGSCDCTVNDQIVHQMRDNDCFDVKVLTITKSAFEAMLGPLSVIIEAHRQRRNTIAAAAKAAHGPQKFSEITVYGIVTSDFVGPLLLGTFGVTVPPADASVPIEPNVTVRTFLISQVERKSLKDSLSRYMDGAKAILAAPISSACMMIPRPISYIREANAAHVVFNDAIVAELGSLIKANTSAVAEHPAMITYAFACLVSALEALHGMQIMYRAVQPESLYVDSLGRIVLLDYRVCKVGLTGTERSFTICGVSDYLAPEQISQSGHSYPVDLWSLGVLLYEVTVGTHPFSAPSEVATYSKISAFGTTAFPALEFPDNFNADTKSLVNQLLVPTPTSRIGAGASGFASLRRHPFFKDHADNWPAIANGTFPSPLALLAKYEKDAMMQEVVDPDELANFTKEYSGRTITDEWLDSLAF